MIAWRKVGSYPAFFVFAVAVTAGLSVQGVRRRSPDGRGGLDHDWLKLCAPGIDHLKELATHARFPELVDVFRDTRDALFVALG